MPHKPNSELGRLMTSLTIFRVVQVDDVIPAVVSDDIQHRLMILRPHAERVVKRGGHLSHLPAG